MRALWLSLAGAVVLCWLGGLDSAVVAQWGDARVVRGTITDCVVTAPGTTTLVGVTAEGPRQIRDRVETCTFLEGPDAGWTMGDPRLAGTGTNRLSLDITFISGLADPEQVTSTLRWGTWEIVGPDGSWVGPWVQLGGRPYVLVAEGTGAYTGLTFVASMPMTYASSEDSKGHGGVFDALIYEGPPPPWALPSATSE